MDSSAELPLAVRWMSIQLIGGANSVTFQISSALLHSYAELAERLDILHQRYLEHGKSPSSGPAMADIPATPRLVQKE